MNELVKWLKENVGDDIQIITPQFERTEPLAYHYKPKTEAEFHAIVNNAPWKILKGLGFGKWDTMNNIIKENHTLKGVAHIPVINGKPGETFDVNMTHKGCPTELLDPDEDVLLFPCEWYDVIPTGYMVTDIFGEAEPFIPGKTDDDKRFGCLSFGIRKPIPHSPDIRKGAKE